MQTIRNFDFNNFFIDLHLRKQYLNKLKTKIASLISLNSKNYRFLNSTILLKERRLIENDFRITYIIDIQFSRANTFLHVTDFIGNLKFSCSAGSFDYEGKSKRSRLVILKKFFHTLISKLKFLQGECLALHLKNVGPNKFWVVKQLKTKFYIRTIRSFSFYPHNGCRKPKVRRKKF
jgi:ribosomal protein S11|uniref:Ribosomal protein S11 n=1 Tax=Phaeodactylum tricornutum TaxID=2850 RepID=A0A6G7IW62_PHATR|nr:ribosomal protein S11 [Phaeodactylum tricornutum]